MVYVLLVDGFEEIEAVTPIDILKRCGVEVMTVGVYSKNVTGSHGIKVETDILINEVDKSKMLLLMLPGGPGYPELDASIEARSLLDYAMENDIYISAICAAPSIIGKRGFLKGRKATCFPGFEKFLEGAEYVSDKAIVDGKIITGKGAGAAAEFGFLMADILVGKQKSAEIKKAMQY